MIKVSFIVIGYNIEHYIEKCINSISKQTLQEIEIVFVDDGSTDQTIHKVKKMQNKDLRIKIIKQRNKGANSARKTGLLNATGKYILFVDGDDWINEKLADDLYTLGEKTLVDIISYNYYLAYENKDCIKITDNKYTNINSNIYLDLILEQKIKHSLCNKFIRKTYIDKTNFNDVCETSIAEDLAANVVLGINKPFVLMIDEAYYYYYQRGNSTMNKSSNKLLKLEKTLNYIQHVLEKNNLLENYCKQLEFLWFIHCYLARVFGSKIKVDNIHKKMYESWKQKNIDINNNPYCKEYMKNMTKYRKFIKYSFDVNYKLGVILLKCEHKLRGIKYN
ncbi:glycosyltransferase family 2 protein [Clostridium butyricum]|nr:glycosyltransferase family 2 protein [Clostridium butyricum]ALP91657.1 hypothetical protein ATN24_16335 [Clostridium butyricum]ANF15277.1 hypothetical protein AZ909_14790 [Clostridium butyricum]AOR95226.1 hypothetical protein BBB49_14350 [Clostridium butyricum]MCI3009510.1 glycosyltransferase [Clostridium butyricum]MDP0841590.1 glycosyltransferase family 2 protein [Clostridium butyricum]